MKPFARVRHTNDEQKRAIASRIAADSQIADIRSEGAHVWSATQWMGTVQTMGVWPVQKGAPIDLGEGAMLSNHNIAARIAIEWPYTVEQVEMVVDAARGSESVTRKALEITKGFSDNHIALACMWARCSGGDVKSLFSSTSRKPHITARVTRQYWSGINSAEYSSRFPFRTLSCQTNTHATIHGSWLNGQRSAYLPCSGGWTH